MRLFSIIKPYKALMLDEARLSTEFKIGFELEGICKNSELQSGDRGLPSYHSQREPYGNAKKLLDMLNERLGLGEGHIESDSSVDPNYGTVTAPDGHTYTDRDENGDAWGFEYVSPIIQFIPKNINKMVNFLKGLKDIGVVTNNHCGFHTHISYPDMSKEDIAWLLFCVANDESLFKEVTEMDEGDYKINFFGNYAQPENLKRLKDLSSNLSNDSTSITNNKYEVLRVHPQGTIEWRGPRNFINDGSAVKTIEDYIKKLYKFIIKIGDIVTRKEYNGFKREDVLKSVSVSGEFNTDVEKKKSAKAENIYKSILKDPSKFFKMDSANLKKMFTPETLRRLSYNDDFINYLSSGKEQASPKTFKTLVDVILKVKQQGDPSAAYRIFNAWFKSYDKILQEFSEYYLKELFKSFGSDRNDNMRPFLDTTAKKLIIKDPELLNKCAKYYFESNAKYFLTILGNNSKYLDINAFMNIVKNDVSLLRMFDSVPKKIQRIITRRNPYAIQYINDPDPSVVDELVKKYGDGIKDYILEKV